jgi:UDP-2,3-diacylglucosamine hydrolase
MKCAFISDLHINSPEDDAAKIFVAFCRHEKTQKSDRIVLLGDIFDFLVGDHYSYIFKYEFFFKEISKLINSGKEVVFIEGNHDFHFKKAFEKYIKLECHTPNKFRYLLSGEELILGDKKYLYCHGYEVDYDNMAFKKWYKIYSSKLFKFFTTYLLTFGLIQKMGAWASKDSKKRGKKTFDLPVMKEKYIQGAKALIKERNIQGVIAGHTHIAEFHTFENGTIYLNTGFPVKDKHFIYFNGEKFQKESLS